MARGDRVRVGDTGHHTEDESDKIYPVYMAVMDDKRQGYYKQNDNGSVVFEFAGGVRGGSIGVIDGEALRTDRKMLKETKALIADMVGTVDYVQMIPVYFEKYQKVAWVPAEHVKIL